MTTERDKIINELKLRLRAGFGENIRLYTADGGIWGSWGRELPCFHYYEMPDRRKLKGNGLYDITFNIQLEYFAFLTRKNELFDEGREKIFQIQSAIELDERFRVHVKADDKLIRTTEELCVEYSMLASEITEIMENTLGVAVIYEFRYIDKFLGYEQARH